MTYGTPKQAVQESLFIFVGTEGVAKYGSCIFFKVSLGLSRDHVYVHQGWELVCMMLKCYARLAWSVGIDGGKHCIGQLNVSHCSVGCA